MKSIYNVVLNTMMFVLLTSGILPAQNSKVYQQNKVAIGGYDPVAYFNVSSPVKGDKQLSVRWQDAEWRFANPDNLEIFKADPEKYAPQFGGYCAYAVANGYTAKSDPESWKIVDSKLYLNFNKEVQKMWEEKRDELIPKAEQNWPKVLNK
jgi:hypothetical protein